MPNSPEVSVVIRAQNPRSDIVELVLDALHAQAVPKDRFELIIVDNNGSPAPLREADILRNGARPFNLNLIHEPHQGDLLAGLHDALAAARFGAAELARRARDAEARATDARRRLSEATRRAARAEAYLDPFLRSRIYRTLWAAGAVRKPSWVDDFVASPRPDPSAPPPPPPPGGDELAATAAALERLCADVAERLRSATAAQAAPSSGGGRESAGDLPHEPTEMDRALRHLVVDKGFHPRVVLDVGSAKGYWSERAAYYYFRDAEFFMIDPLPTSVEHLTELAARSPKFHYIITAVGSQPGELVMNLTPDADGSSLLDFPNPDPSRQLMVPIETLDRLLAAGRIQPPDLIKIDVQGYEMEVLRGAAEILRAAEVVIIEVNFYEFMPKAPLVHEVVAFMVERGFRVYDLAGSLRRPFENDLGQIDLVFVANRSPLVASNRWA